ncbi:MAG: tetratricopeptide repeat protein [Bryobacteraceae bacterium]
MRPPLIPLLLVLAAVCLPAQVSESPQPGSTKPDAAPVASQPAPEPLTPEKRADIYMARKMYREAIELYRKVEEELAAKLPARKPRREDESYRQAANRLAVILNKIGIAYHQLHELDTARQYYERAVKLNPRYAEAINNIGTVHYAQKNYRRAISQYKKALKISPESASIYSNLGTAYFARRNYKEASKAYAKALELDPDVFEHRSTYGVLLQERNVEERARFHYYLAKVYAQAGMNERALLYIRKALEEGFKDRRKFIEEPEFAGLQELSEFKELMAMEFRAL